MLITLIATFPQLAWAKLAKGGNIKMRKGSVLSIAFALVTAQLLMVNLVQPAMAAEPKSSVILTLLHNNDGESSLGADAIYKSAGET